MKTIDSNGHLQKRNLFQSLQHNASSLSIKSVTSISSNNSSVPSAYSNHSEFSQQNPFMAITLTSSLKRDDDAKISALMRPNKSLKFGVKGTHHESVHENMHYFGQPKTNLNLKSSIDFPFTFSSNGVPDMPQLKKVVVSPVEPFSPTSISHHGYDVPMTHPYIRLIHSDDKSDNQPYALETDDRLDSTPITKSSPLTPKKSVEKDISKITVPEGFASDKPPTSPNVPSPPLNSTTTDSNPSIPPQESSPVRKVEGMIPSLFNFVTPLLSTVTEFLEKVQPVNTQQWRPPLRPLQGTSESGDPLPSDDFFTPAPDHSLAREMDELECSMKMESPNQLEEQSRTSPETLSSRTTTISKAELRPQLQTLQEGNSIDVASLVKERYEERQQAVQIRFDKVLAQAELLCVQAENKSLTIENESRQRTISQLKIALDEAKHEQDKHSIQLDKALAELRNVQAENKRLNSENQSQQRSISRHKIALDEAKREQNKSLIKINNQLGVATASLTLLNKEKKGWQDKLDSMLQQLNAAERQVRCLGHLTRQKLESRQEAGYGELKQRLGGPLAFIPASADVIEAMRALNKKIFQTCELLVQGLERTTIFSTKHKSQVEKVLGYRLTAMMGDQAKKKSTSGYNVLLMQTVLEVFMTHWCSSIIEAFYPQQESFGDLLVQLSAQTSTKSSGK